MITGYGNIRHINYNPKKQLAQGLIEELEKNTFKTVGEYTNESKNPSKNITGS